MQFPLHEDGARELVRKANVPEALQDHCVAGLTGKEKLSLRIGHRFFDALRTTVLQEIVAALKGAIDYNCPIFATASPRPFPAIYNLDDPDHSLARSLYFEGPPVGVSIFRDLTFREVTDASDGPRRLTGIQKDVFADLLRALRPGYQPFSLYHRSSRIPPYHWSTMALAGHPDVPRVAFDYEALWDDEFEVGHCSLQFGADAEKAYRHVTQQHKSNLLAGRGTAELLSALQRSSR